MAEVGGGRKVVDGLGVAGDAGFRVELDEQVAVGREGEGDVEPSARGVALDLLQAVSGRVALRLGFDQGYGHEGLGPIGHGQAQGVVDAALGPAAGLARDEVDRSGGLLAADEVFGPAATMEGGVYQLGLGVGFAKGHDG